MERADNTDTKNCIAVIGGGAAGCMAAIFAAESFRGQVILLEASDRLLKKVQVTGNGRCNLTNLDQDPAYYQSVEKRDSRSDIIAENVAAQGPGFICDFFEKECGVYLHTRGETLVYPVSDKAQTIVRALTEKLSEKGVQIHVNAEVTSLIKESDSFRIETRDRSLFIADRVILACGSRAGKNFSPETDSYQLAKCTGHHLTRIRPTLTMLKTDLPGFDAGAGARCEAVLSLISENNPEEIILQEKGELQLVKDGLSGIVAFQLSHVAGQLLFDREKPVVRIDFLPGIPDEKFREEISRRLVRTGKKTVADLFFGLVCDQIASVIIRAHGQVEERRASKAADEDLKKMLLCVKAFPVPIIGTGSLDAAQAAAGGVSLRDIDDHYASLVMPGIYFAGEMLDVDGLCGGYNLTFALMSGKEAGRFAADSMRNI